MAGEASVLIFSPNLALDHIIEVEQLVVGGVQRALTGSLSAGGKGVNAARAANCIGLDAHVIGLVGGSTGDVLRALLAEEGIDVQSPAVDTLTRIATIVVDHSAGTTTVLNEPGPVLRSDDWTALTDLLETRLDGASTLACTGSLPPGMADDAYVSVLAMARDRGVPTIVDAAGATLRAMLTASPTVIKVNADEAARTLDKKSAGAEQAKDVAIRLAQALHDRSGSVAIVTIDRGAALAHAGGRAFVESPVVEVINEVGAGDSFLAALAGALPQGVDVTAACVRAVAVAAASVETAQPGMLSSARAQILEKSVLVENM
ncbi:MAG TPA: hexose kinase [Micromonosporaceae bacterium]|jgi:1-phosphofructokinase family hexose kinase